MKQTTFAEAAERLAASRPWQQSSREPASSELNAWPLLNPWGIMTAIWLGWAMAHVATGLLLS